MSIIEDSHEVSLTDSSDNKEIKKIHKFTEEDQRQIMLAEQAAEDWEEPLTRW